MSERKTYKLGEVTVNFDSRRVPVKAADRKPGGFPYYGASGVVDYVDGYLFDGDYLLIAEDGENLRTRKTPVAFMASGKFWVNNHAHIVQGSHLANTHYLCYALANADVSGFLSGSTQPKLTQAALNSVQLQLPSRKYQDAVIDVLGALDDKIAVNERIADCLDALSRVLFQAFSAASGGDPGGGWRDGILSDLCSTQYGYTVSATSEPIGPKLLRVTDINKRNWVEWGSVPHCSVSPADKGKYALSVGDILVARMADPGKSAIIEQPVDAVFASYLVRLKTPSLAHAYYVFGILKSEAYAEYVEGVKGGSVQANMNAKSIVAARMSIPPLSVMEAHLMKVLPLRQKIMATVKEVAALAALRDMLLPKLMSGEIRVRDAEKAVEDAT